MGNLLSFTVAYLSAKQRGGFVRLRIEDLDPDRSKQCFIDALLRDLDWFGFEWEGEAVRQSERTDAYREAFEKLQAQGLLYPCFCTRADLHAANAPHFGEELVYPNTCKSLSTDERDAAEAALWHAARRKPARRVIVPSKPYSFHDGFQGLCTYNLTECSGDFIVQRADGVFAYQLAVVVDDAESGVNEVVRGVDLLNSVPRQLFLQERLGLEHPAYFHVPLLVDAEGRRLSKRNADASLQCLIEEEKRHPEEILGHLAWLAGIIGSSTPRSLGDLIREANLDALKGKRELLWQPLT